MEEEKEYLKRTLESLNLALKNLEIRIEESSKQVDYLLEFISGTFNEMDEEERATQNTLLYDEEYKLSQKKELEERLNTQKQSPYFGSIVFEQKNETDKIYVGTASVLEQDNDKPLVSDWRAPVSSLFYDFELGRADYKNEGESYEGNITQKRQYKIENGKLEYYFDSGLLIEDEILQQTLAKSTDGQMKNIVATIQKEQNKIIRNDSLENILVQGLAGSGKTSVALHRAAYLLYKYKDTLSSKDILIISPNTRFSSYISNVLPSLGEKDIEQTTFYEIAKNEFGSKIKFETKENMFENLILNKGERLNEFAIKESFEFLEDLKNFLASFANVCFVARDVVLGQLVIKKEKLENMFYEIYKEKSPKVRVDWIADYICDELNVSKKTYDEINQRTKNLLYTMFISSDIVEIYKKFLNQIGLKTNIGEEIINYEDVAPLLLIQEYFYGVTKKLEIKHLIVDEMQDYSPIYFEIISKMFSCKKTILGDINQSLLKNIDNQYLTQLANQIGNCKLIEMNKCYRSTKPIIDYAASMLNLSGYESVRKGGSEVEVFDIDNVYEKVAEKIKEFKKEFKSVAIICENKFKAQETYLNLGQIENLVLVDETTEFENDIYLMSAPLSKGLEFDGVIVLMPKPKSQILKKLYYVASSRALHKLAIIYLK